LNPPGPAPRYIINVPTKRHWSEYSSLTLVRKSVEGLADAVRSRKIRSVAVPALGCGLGGLPWADVAEVLENVLGDLDADVMLYPPYDLAEVFASISTKLKKHKGA
jgi:O-acetyl-ADP-ribose deacetylase (regulator of RNase III)